MEEKFLEIRPFPDLIDHINLSTCFKVLWDYLCVYAYENDPLEAWITKASYTKLLNVSSDLLPGYLWQLQSLGVAKNGNVLFDLDGLDLILFNPREKTSKIFPIDQEDGYNFKPIEYVESLVCPKSNGGFDDMQLNVW